MTEFYIRLAERQADAKQLRLSFLRMGSKRISFSYILCSDNKLYGVKIGRLFAGESMFNVRRDASKVALMALVQLMRDTGMTLLDVQWRTDHLESLGAIGVARERYLALLAEALASAGT